MEFIKLLGKVSNFIKTATENVTCVIMFLVTMILFSQVLMRTIVHTNFPWAEEVARLGMVWITMLGGSLLVKEKDLISVDFLDPYLAKWLLKYRSVLISALLVWLCSVLVYEGYLQADFGRTTTLTTLPVSMFWAYLAIPVGASFMLFHYFVNTCEDFAGLNIKGDIE